MKPNIEHGASTDAAILHGEAEWLRFQAEMAERLAGNLEEAAALAHEHRCRVASEFPDFVSPPPDPVTERTPPPAEIEPEYTDFNDARIRDTNAFIGLAANPLVRELPEAPPSGLLDQQRAFKEAWMGLTEPEATFRDLIQTPTLAEFSDNGPEVVPLANVRLQATARPSGALSFSAAPDNTRGVSGKALGTQRDQLGLFSRLGNIHGEVGTTWMTARSARTLTANFLVATGFGAGEITIKGKLHFWLDLECELAESSSFLAPRPQATRPDAAFMHSVSTIAYQQMDFSSPAKPPLFRGVVPLWDAEAEWYSFMRNPAVALEDQKWKARHGWLHIDTGRTVEIKFDNIPSISIFHIALVDHILTSNTAEMVAYMHARSLYRLKTVRVQIVS